jgi:Tol biopolymer transport system component
LLYTTFVNRTPAILALVPGRGTPEELVRDAAGPAVSADGRTMVFQAFDRDDRLGSLWKADADGSHRVRLVSGLTLGAVVTNGDRQVVYGSQQSGQQSLWTVPLAGGAPRQLSPVFASAPDVAPNGTTLLFASRDGRGGVPLLVCELPDCAARPIARPPNFGGLPHWMPGGRAVAYVDTTQFNLWTQSPDGGPPRQLTHFNDGRTITGFAWSRDGRRLAIARSLTTNDIVLFKGLKR